MRGWSRREWLASVAALGAAGLPRAALAKDGAWLIEHVAAAYGLGPGEADAFRASHELYRRILPKGTTPHDADDPVRQAVVELAGLIRSRGSTSVAPSLFNGRPGVIQTRPFRGARFVVFSDHHLSTWRHRHNVFSGSGGSHFRWSNLTLYVAVLQRYREAGYTLVENGDIEDLVVFDPALHPGEFDRRLTIYDDAGGGDQGLAALDRHRATFRAHLLADILSDPKNAAYYQILAELDADSRLIRLAGNHDWQVVTAWPEAVARAEAAAAARGNWIQTFPKPSCFADLLALEQNERWGGVLLHGHAFDRSSSPLRASRHGETISECLGTWFQGADRVWSWATHGAAWAHGRPFRNMLVSGTSYDRQTLLERVRRNGGYSVPVVLDARLRLQHPSPLDAQVWETLFEHPIAWDHFLDDPDEAGIAEESAYDALVIGTEWLKFRHTEELLFTEELPKEIASPPLVVLGHTHEPRCDAIDEHGRPATWYLNSGAVGRFEGLMWGVEIVDGEPFVVSWHAEPFPHGIPVRQRWGPAGAWRHLMVGRVEDLA